MKERERMTKTRKVERWKERGREKKKEKER